MWFVIGLALGLLLGHAVTVLWIQRPWQRF